MRLSEAKTLGGVSRLRIPYQPGKLAIVGLLIPIAAGRWGSYLAIPGTPIYIADVLVALGVGGLIFAVLTNRDGRPRADRTPASLPLGAAVLVVLVAAWTLFTPSQDILLVIRDAVPIFYLALLPLLANIVNRFSDSEILRWLRIACIFHTIWFTLAVFRILPPVNLGAVTQVPLFTVRTDYDLLVSGLAIAVFATDQGLSNKWRYPLITVAAASLLAGGSRAGLIAGIAFLILATVLGRRRGSRVPAVLVASIAFATAIIVPVALTVLSDPPPWMRGIARIVSIGSNEQVSASNTWNARLYAWDRLIAFTLADPDRARWGSGLGSQPIIDSGALIYLSGNTTVRAGHNFLITWFAYYGIVGALLIAGILLVWCTIAFASAVRERGLNGIGWAFAASILLAGLAGVIVESPFGYMSLLLGLSLALRTASRPEPFFRQVRRNRRETRVPPISSGAKNLPSISRQTDLA